MTLTFLQISLKFVQRKYFCVYQCVASLFLPNLSCQTLGHGNDKFSVVSLEILFHSQVRIEFIFCPSCGRRCGTLRFNIRKRFSIGLRSGLDAGHMEGSIHNSVATCWLNSFSLWLCVVPLEGTASISEMFEPCSLKIRLQNVCIFNGIDSFITKMQNTDPRWLPYIPKPLLMRFLYLRCLA